MGAAGGIERASAGVGMVEGTTAVGWAQAVLDEVGQASPHCLPSQARPSVPNVAPPFPCNASPCMPSPHLQRATPQPDL
jgi:hypothetical protein